MSSFDEIMGLLDAVDAAPCYEPRIERLKSWGRDTKLIEDGIADVLRVLEAGTRSFVVYGEPQSGKTEFMIALACKLIDEGYKTIFIVMNDNTELEQQNFDRFRDAQELNPSPMRDFQVARLPKGELREKHPRIIFCRKNARNLEKLIEHCRFMDKRVVIDDEADFATPNTKINKNEVTKINECVGKLGHLSPDQKGVYIGVTATPGRLDLNNTFFNEADKWVFLRSHAAYKGRSFFFPETSAEASTSDYRLVLLPEEKDDPKLLRSAVFRFMLRVAALNRHPNGELTAYSMLIHTKGITHDHEVDEEELQKIIGILKKKDGKNFEKYVNELNLCAETIVNSIKIDISPSKLVLFVLRNIGRSEILVINHKNDSQNVARACQPAALFTFAIGGNIVSRGLTFERLLTFYFSRNVKGKLQQNTYIQRARMFGNRPYSDFFELCVPKSLFEDWADCFSNHELSLRLARAGHYQHVERGRVSVSDAAAIDAEHVIRGSSERAIGDKFALTDALEKRLLEPRSFGLLDLLNSLLADGLVPEAAFPRSLIKFIEETCKADQSDVFLVLSKKFGLGIQRIEQFGDAHVEEIVRPRGGMVQAILKGSPDYERHTHYILPIKNDLGMMRFTYKTQLGYRVLQNIRTVGT